MLYLENPKSTFTYWSGQPIGGVTHPSSIETLWSSQELAAVGLYVPASPDIPDGKNVASFTVARVNGVVTKVYVLEDVPPLENISKNIIWERMTDQEAAQADALLKAQPPKVLRIYEGATYISTKAELYPQLLGAMTQLFGAERAAEILKPNF
jgi:hypothetical protein